MKKYKIGNVLVSETSVEDAVIKIEKAILQKSNEYICVGNVRTTVYANFHVDYRIIINNAFMNTPDGMPLIWASKCWGLNNVERTCGPDLFISMLQKPNIKHFFLGDSEEVLSNLKEKCNKLYNSNIIGTYSPPFTRYEEYDYNAIAKKINESDAHIIWVALGAPKQDFFAARLSPFLNGKIIIGVGAAFRFVLGEYKHPPLLFKQLGLTGLFWRFRKKPFSETWWYIKHTALFSILLLQILIYRVIGKNK